MWRRRRMGKDIRREARKKRRREGGGGKGWMNREARREGRMG